MCQWIKSTENIHYFIQVALKIWNIWISIWIKIESVCYRNMLLLIWLIWIQLMCKIRTGFQLSLEHIKTNLKSRIAQKSHFQKKIIFKIALIWKDLPIWMFSRIKSSSLSICCTASDTIWKFLTESRGLAIFIFRILVFRVLRLSD